MARQRLSKYKRAPKEECPMRFDKRDWGILELFGPQQGFQFLTAPFMSLLLERPLNPLQHRLQKLFHHEYLGRWYRPHSYEGGSSPAVYYLDSGGAKKLKERYGTSVRPKRLDSQYHPFLMHSVLVDRFRAIAFRAVREYGDGLVIPYEWRDRRFTDYFGFEQIHDDKDLLRPAKCKVVPDWLFAFAGGRDHDADTGPFRNFFLELQRSNRAVKNPKRRQSAKKSLRHKMLSYHHFFKIKRWEKWSEKKQNRLGLRDPKNMRVLFVTEGMSKQEHRNLINIARQIDEQKVGLRLFWFVRLEDLGEQPHKTLLQPIWRTPIAGDPRRSIFD